MCTEEKTDRVDTNEVKLSGQIVKGFRSPYLAKGQFRFDCMVAVNSPSGAVHQFKAQGRGEMGEKLFHGSVSDRAISLRGTLKSGRNGRTAVIVKTFEYGELETEIPEGVTDSRKIFIEHLKAIDPSMEVLTTDSDE